MLIRPLPLFLLVLVGIAPFLAIAEEPTHEGLLLRVGTYWIYRGTVKWIVPNSDKVPGKVLSWKMEVVQSARVGRYEIALLKGHPEDLAGYEPGRPRGDYLIVRDQRRYYLLTLRDPGRELAAFLSEAPQLESRLDSSALFLDLPLREGTCFGQDPDLNPDIAKQVPMLWCWYVEKQKRPTLDGVKGISPKRQVLMFRLSWRGLTAYTIVDFVPGVGITRYVFRHVAGDGADLRLVEYHPGRGP